MSSVFVIITGASKGIGRSCAISFSRYSSNIKKLRICLLARNEDGLKETAHLASVTQDETKTKEVDISTHQVDLSDMDGLEERIQDIMNRNVEPVYEQFDHYILINNAGSLGHLGKASALPSPKDLMQNVELNLVSSCWLSSYFVRWFHQMNEKETEKTNGAIFKKCTVVNMSSLCAISSFPTMAVYCAGKAYRDMYHQTMALEESKAETEDDEVNKVKILNYAPGAIVTDMTDTLANSPNLDSGLSEFFNGKDETKFVKVEDTSNKLVNLVLQGNFENGKHIDYWDDIE